VFVAIAEDILQQLKVNAKRTMPLTYRQPIYGRVLDNGSVVQVLSLDEQTLPQVGHFLYLTPGRDDLSAYLPKEAKTGQICLCFTELIEPQVFVLGWTDERWETLDYNIMRLEGDLQSHLDSLFDTRHLFNKPVIIVGWG
jgi:hypothetical protein